MLLVAAAPVACCSESARCGYRTGRAWLVAPCRAGALLGAPFAPRGGLCDRLVARQDARNYDEMGRDTLGGHLIAAHIARRQRRYGACWFCCT